MQKHGWIDAFPMMVVSRNGKLEIRDGQNRFHAAQLIGAPVKYVVTVNGQSDIPIAELNKHQKTWTTMDHCKSYANEGDRDYQILLKFMAEEKLALTPAAILLSQGPGSAATLKSGNYKVVDLEWARWTAARLRHLKKVMPWSPFNTNFVRVFVKACRITEFDPELLARKIEQNPDKCVQMATETGLAAMLETIYNFRNRNPIALAHLIGRVSAENRCMTASKKKSHENAAAS